MKSEQFILSLDQGTTSSRAILFDHAGSIRSMAQQEFTQIYPQPGWVEHDPEEIWRTQLAVAKLAIAKIGVSPSDIAAIGITNQRETTVVWDKETGRPVSNAIVWQCRRTAERIGELAEAGYGQMIREKTGLVPDAYFSASKIEWILTHTEGAMEKAAAGKLLFGTVDSWLIWKLTGGKVHATDYTNASRTMIFDISKLEWDKELLGLFHIPESMMPEVCPSGYRFGTTDPSLFGEEIPILSAVGDQQAALFGQGCFYKGDVKNTYGTGSFILMNTGKERVDSRNGLVTTIAAGTEREVQYALEGSVFVAGAAIQWLRDSVQMIESSPQSETYAKAAKDTQGVYVVPAFTGLGAPYWDPYARGMIVGLTRGSGKNELVRATLESIAYQSHDVIRAMEEDVGAPINALKVDGGASANDFLMAFQADIENTAVERPRCVETTALGAAYLAGLTCGYWKDREEILENWQLDKRFEPSMPEEKRKALLDGWKKAVRCAMIWAKP